MKRGWVVGVGLLVVGAGAVIWSAWPSQPREIPSPSLSRQTLVLGPTPALQKLQWLADESGCPVSDNPALMASCVRQKLWKGREKARQRLERYEALINLDREYWKNLHREGLVPLTQHVRPEMMP